MKEQQEKDPQYLNRYKQKKSKRRKNELLYLCTGAGAVLIAVFILLMTDTGSSGPGADVVLENAKNLHEQNHEHRKAIKLIKKKLIPVYPSDHWAVQEGRALKQEIQNVLSRQKKVRHVYDTHIARLYREQKNQSMPERLTIIMEVEDEIDEFLKQHKKFITSHPETKAPGSGSKTLYSAINGIRADLAEQEKTLYTDYYEELKQEIFTLLMKDKLSPAYKKATAFNEKFGSRYSPPANNLLEKVNTRLKELYKTVAGRVKKYRSRGKLGKAVKVLARYQSSFKETPYEEKITRKLEQLKRQAGSSSLGLK